MTHQPNDVSHWMFDESRFNQLNNTLSFQDDSLISSSKPDMNSGEYSPPKFDEFFDPNIADPVINDSQDSSATPILAPAYQGNEGLSPEDLFDDSELVDPSKGPINEVTVTTTSCENDLLDGIPPSLNQNEALTSEDIESLFNEIRNQMEYMYLQTIDRSIEQRSMSVGRQPPTNLRPRYKSDGKRQIEESRTKPMTVTLPNLKDIQLEDNVTFHLRLGLIKCDEDPSAQKYLHVNTLEYHSDDAQQLADETVSVALTSDEINKGEKALPRLSIVRTKLGEYRSELTPYCLTENDNQAREDTNNHEDIKVKEAKKIYKTFNMKASRIVCQLLIKQNETIYYTNITCETDEIIEKDPSTTNNKRPADPDESEVEGSTDERPCSSKSAKRKKTH